MAYKSRALSPAEQRYAQIEKEALAFTWASETLSDNLLGLHFHIETDHKPLVPHFGPQKNFNELPLRLQRFRLRMIRYSFSISHVSGKHLTVADSLSRATSTDPGPTDREFQRETTFYVSSILSYIPATETRVAEIKEHQQEDRICRQLTEFCLTQWPQKQDLSPELRPYHSVAYEVSVEDGLLLRGNCMVIPHILRNDILKRIHTGHLGIAKCRERELARECGGQVYPQNWRSLSIIALSATRLTYKAQNPYAHHHSLTCPSRRWHQICLN